MEVGLKLDGVAVDGNDVVGNAVGLILGASVGLDDVVGNTVGPKLGASVGLDMGGAVVVVLSGIKHNVKPSSGSLTTSMTLRVCHSIMVSESIVTLVRSLPQ